MPMMTTPATDRMITARRTSARRRCSPGRNRPVGRRTVRLSRATGGLGELGGAAGQVGVGLAVDDLFQAVYATLQAVDRLGDVSPQGAEAGGVVALDLGGGLGRGLQLGLGALGRSRLASASGMAVASPATP